MYYYDLYKDDVFVKSVTDMNYAVYFIVSSPNENRTIEILGETDWKVQLDNQLPTSMNDPIFIQRHEWHRVIKGTGTLKLKIHKS